MGISVWYPAFDQTIWKPVVIVAKLSHVQDDIHSDFEKGEIAKATRLIELQVIHFIVLAP